MFFTKCRLLCSARRNRSSDDDDDDDDEEGEVDEEEEETVKEKNSEEGEGKASEAETEKKTEPETTQVKECVCVCIRKFLNARGSVCLLSQVSFVCVYSGCLSVVCVFQVDLSQAETESLLRNELRPATKPFKGNKLFLRHATHGEKTHFKHTWIWKMDLMCDEYKSLTADVCLPFR